MISQPIDERKKGMPKIDAHVHLWDATRNDDILVLSKIPKLAEAASRARLSKYLDDNFPDRAIVVQSAPDAGHSEWLLGEAELLPNIAGVVAWIDPFDSHAPAEINRLAANQLVCGIRLMMNRMEEPRLLLNDNALNTLARLADHGITIECLAPLTTLPLVAELANQLPQALFVLDHLGFPPLNAMQNQQWLDGIDLVASYPNVSTKFSGFIEAYPQVPDVQDLLPIAHRIVNRFGADRIMAASNFPVIECVATTTRWDSILNELLKALNLPAKEIALIRYGNAMRWFPRIGVNLSRE